MSVWEDGPQDPFLRLKKAFEGIPEAVIAYSLTMASVALAAILVRAAVSIVFGA